ncbi:unnamed protein product (macronuclear) [Paramecium tetraurelia]|uniref:Uncharacterized protein n=1 Tax=Paramecium tetraurelia TaxID=5888 RepID=A0BXB5_PARTE|nr:uncharacterized protein GSPATT00033035001 [Paramecium tetraurelia]CAK63182.1 unnamed protein product [Paramecium tetraurelia]|eukprot:XP_001430580.1 hypothetical protein (macronuclear) [Paramecium tetraurelia strain d4-2]
MNYLNIIEQSQIDKLKAQLEKKEQTISTLQTIIESQKEQINQYQHEKQQLVKNIQLQVQQKFQDDLNFENIIRKLKQDLEQKSIQFEQMTMRLNQNDPGFLLMKLKNEAEEPHRIEILQKEQIIDELKRQILQLKNQLQLQVERNNAIQIANQNELAQLKEKYESNLGVDKLSLRQVKELNQLNERDQQQIQELLKDKEQQQNQIIQKDNTIKELRFQNEQLHKSKQQIIETLTQELEIERINRRKLQQENDDLESALSNIRLTMKVNYSTNVKSDGTTIKDQEFIDLQNRLNEYIRLFEEEKDQKKKLSQKLNDIIIQTKQEKSDSDKIYENRIKDLQEQIKEEKGMKSKQSMKIKDLYADIEEMKHELNILRDNQARIEERAKEVEVRERKVIERDMKLNELQREFDLKKPPEELMYDNKKIKTKYKQAKKKLIEANQKIVVLLTKIKDYEQNNENSTTTNNKNNVFEGKSTYNKQGYTNTDQQRKQMERQVFKNQSYEGYYDLPQDADYLGNPYQTEFQMDRISQRLREDIVKQKNSLETLEHKYNILK